MVADLAPSASTAKRESNVRSIATQGRPRTPAFTRPARPRLCLALALDTQVSTRVAILLRLSKRFSFNLPASMLWRRQCDGESYIKQRGPFNHSATTHTNTTSSMVILVSAMLVEITILRTPSGGLLKMAFCSCVLSVL